MSTIYRDVTLNQIGEEQIGKEVKIAEIGRAHV